MQTRIRTTLLEMESNVEGEALLADLEMKRLTRVSDEDYDPIRERAQKAQLVHFGNQ